MKSIFKCLSSLSLPALLLATMPASCVVAQESVEEAVGQLADEIGEAIESWVEENDVEEIGEEVGEAIEQWLRDNSEELESWSEEYGDRWGAWAKRFEKKISRWAKSHERDWNDWSKEYSDRLEAWSRKLESDELEVDQLGKLIENNIEMLSDIPLGKLIDGALKEGLSQLEDAPWDSIDDLQSMIRRSIEQSVEKAEELADRVDRLNAAERPERRRGDRQEGDTEFILPVDGKSQRGNESKRSAIKSELDRKKELRELLNNKNTDWEDVEKVIAEMKDAKRRSVNEPSVDRVERARAARKEAIEKARRAAEDRLKIQNDIQRQQRQADLEPESIIRNVKEAAAKSQDRQLKELANQLVKALKESAASRESLNKINQQLAKEQKKLDEEEGLIEKLKRQIRERLRDKSGN